MEYYLVICLVIYRKNYKLYLFRYIFRFIFSVFGKTTCSILKVDRDALYRVRIIQYGLIETTVRVDIRLSPWYQTVPGFNSLSKLSSIDTLVTQVAIVTVGRPLNRMRALQRGYA